ncbi:secreted protein [Colletotrichum kahawae]|uniref:Secreted protein n=1 Tax=Colletotrichum kahawae TaxID=34407 RepID=A0AAD9Y865_COLKA|nr:secreted protein [Colletotrichum kahawae]
MRIATALDIPEGESLGFQVIDDYRVLAGANSFAGVNIMSNDLGAYNKAAYATTRNKILETVNPQFAAGLTHNVLHGFSYISGPETTWPGWGAFTPYKGRIGYSESWGLFDANSTDVITDVKHLLSLRNVVNVANSSDIPTGLEKLGSSPAVTHSASPLIHIRREHGDFDLYFFTANSSSTGVSQDVWLPIRHEYVAPLELDPWSGEVNLAGRYTIVDGRLNILTSIEPQQSKLLIVAPSSADVLHVVNSTADLICRNSTSGQLFVRNGEAGDLTIALSNDSQLIASFKAPLPTIGLTDWALGVDDWQPANESPSDDVEDIVATQFVHHSYNITSLSPWSDIDGLQNVSGNATYWTDFVLGTTDAPYGSSAGAYMELNMFQGSFRAEINGEALGALDQMAHRFDVGKWLRNGTNTLEIEVATSLINRMRAFQPQYYEVYARQKYGLKSVTIRPFSQSAV